MLRLRGLNLSAFSQLLVRSARPLVERGAHVFLCIADHFEPQWQQASHCLQRERLMRWVRDYPRAVAGCRDSTGRLPQHTFFYPAEEYRSDHLDGLASLCQAGYGDVEVHLHHDNDCAQRLRDTLENFKETLYYRHGLLHKNDEGRITYGFIHGNWALDNSRRDGRWCGVNNELTVLAETGCYADFTLPSAPSSTQTTTVNRIYYALDDPCRPKSHDRGTPARRGLAPPRNTLLMVQGPLMLDWSRRKWGFLPGLENGNLTAAHPPSLRRLKLWLGAGVRVVGQPDWYFIKLHTHGCQEKNMAMLLGKPMRAFRQALAALAARHDAFRFYYVTARELANLVGQAEAGEEAPAIGSRCGQVPQPVSLGGASSQLRALSSSSESR